MRLTPVSAACSQPKSAMDTSMWSLGKIATLLIATTSGSSMALSCLLLALAALMRGETASMPPLRPKPTNNWSGAPRFTSERGLA